VGWGEIWTHDTHKQDTSPHLNTYFHETQRGSLLLQSWPLHTTRFKLTTRFKRDTREGAAGQNDHIHSLTVKKKKQNTKQTNKKTKPKQTLSNNHFCWLLVNSCSATRQLTATSLTHLWGCLHHKRTKHHLTSRGYFSTDSHAVYHT